MNLFRSGRQFPSSSARVIISGGSGWGNVEECELTREITYIHCVPKSWLGRKRFPPLHPRR